jgi:hypothetical protein
VKWLASQLSQGTTSICRWSCGPEIRCNSVRQPAHDGVRFP